MLEQTIFMLFEHSNLLNLVLNSMGSSDGKVAKLGKVYLEPIVRDVAGLFQAWHAFVDIQVYPSV